MSASSQPRRPPRWWLGVLAWPLCGLSFLGLVVTVWLDQLLRQAGRPEFVSIGPAPVAVCQQLNPSPGHEDQPVPQRREDDGSPSCGMAA